MDIGIFALSSGYIKSAISVIRIVKKDVLFDIYNFIDKKKVKPRYATLVNIYSDREKKRLIDNCILIFFEGNKSYCGVDTVELYTHGSLFIVKEIYKLLDSLGYREAEPGEFSKLAVINGKMDLIQAEAINNLINSETQQAYENSLKNLGKEFSNKLNYYEKLILEISSFLEASLEYPEEDLDIEDIQLAPIYNNFEILINEINKILNKASAGISLHSHLNVVIIGPTNSGKSSLFNILLKKDRSIVSDVHGTTRDYIESELFLGNLHLTLYDTAGLRQSEDKIENIGMQRVQDLIKKADFIIFLIAIDSFLDIKLVEVYEKYKEKIVIVLNKIDLIFSNKENFEDLQIEIMLSNIMNSSLVDKKILDFIEYNKQDILPISIEHRFGIKNLEQFIREKLEIQLNNNELKEDNRYLYIQNVRQKVLLEDILNYIKDAEINLKERSLYDIAAENLRNAYLKINELTGKVYSKELFDVIFSKFCLGK